MMMMMMTMMIMMVIMMVMMMLMLMLMLMLLMMMMVIIDDVSSHLEDLENPDCRAVARERQQSWKKVVMSLLVFLLIMVTVCPVISFIFLRVPCLSTFCLWVGQRMVWHAPGGEGLHHTHAALSLTLRFQILFSVLDSRHGGSTKT